jgi:hypothetical protein
MFMCAVKAYIAEIHVSLWAVRGQGTDPCVPRHCLE